ncbi:MAG: hypothetical protein JSU80_07450, partial [Deltaproteobacteria bacterium]
MNTLKRKRDDYKRRNGTTVYNTIKEELDLNKYLEFKKSYPHSTYLSHLKERLKASDRTLPPEKYWSQPVQKNSKRFYELKFGSEHNGHLMIYIPGKRIWIDKYEVSWGQFRKFLDDWGE